MIDNAVAHVVYDLSLPLEERKQKAIKFRTAKAAARFLGIGENRVPRYVYPGKRIERNGKLYAIRIAK